VVTIAAATSSALETQAKPTAQGPHKKVARTARVCFPLRHREHIAHSRTTRAIVQPSATRARLGQLKGRSAIGVASIALVAAIEFMQHGHREPVDSASNKAGHCTAAAPRPVTACVRSPRPSVALRVDHRPEKSVVGSPGAASWMNTSRAARQHCRAIPLAVAIN